MEWRSVGDDGSLQPICDACGYVLWQHPFPSVDALIVRASDSGFDVLLGRRLREPSKGMWDVPGAFIGIDDDPVEVIRRECLNEFAARVEVSHPLGVFTETFQDKHLISIFYVCHLVADDYAASDRVDVINWYPIDQLPQLAFPSIARAIESLR
jgi:ADP-ribose pyrophosphatase YjhB (NUDIX family)